MRSWLGVAFLLLAIDAAGQTLSPEAPTTLMRGERFRLPESVVNVDPDAAFLRELRTGVARRLSTPCADAPKEIDGYGAISFPKTFNPEGHEKPKVDFTGTLDLLAKSTGRSGSKSQNLIAPARDETSFAADPFVVAADALLEVIVAAPQFTKADIAELNKREKGKTSRAIFELRLKVIRTLLGG